MKLFKTMARNKTRHTMLTCSIVIALCSVSVITSVQCNSVAVDQTVAKQSPPVLSHETSEAVVKQQKDQIVEAKSLSAPVVEQTKPSEPSSAAKLAQEANIVAEQTRKGRSDAPPTAAPSESAPKTSGESAKSATSSKPSASKPAAPSTSSQTKQHQLTGKSGSSTSSGSSSSAASKKLPANLGTVTSTGSGGPAHYMSKHDAYSAIAEKHGALAQDAMRKADKRNSHNLQRFSGIQKASGFTDALNPFKTVTDGGLARNIGASMRSIMKGKYSIPAYVASAVLGAVALMAFYESPISPLPVPALPEPPVGRFPPEMPVISPNLQVPFRMNQQQQQQQQYGQQYGQQNGYGNQRSFQTSGPMTSNQQQQQQQQQQPQQPQQVLFPGAQSAQQRAGSAPGPVQQLAANLISSVSPSRQTAQRKSGPDQEPASSRSFFASSSQLNTNKLGAPANQQHKQGGNSLLSFLGFGGSSASGSNQAGSSSSPSSTLSQAAPLAGLGDVHRASGMNSHSMSSGTSHDTIAASLSNSHLVNKMKSYFDRPVPHNSWSMDHNVPNQYDQYRRMSIMQALAKDTAFLSSFFSPSRRSSNSTSATNPIQQSINAVLSSATGSGGQSAPAATQQVASSRMQVDTVPALPALMSSPFGSMQPAAGQPVSAGKRTTSGYGLMKVADRVTHALLDTFTSGLMHRSSESATSKKAAAALEEQQQQQNALASATSILSDIMSSYNAAQQASSEMNNPANNQQQSHNSQQVSESGAKHQSAVDQGVGGEQASGRSAEAGTGADKPSAEQQSAGVAPPSTKIQTSSQSSSAVPEQQQASSQQQLNRKVRSIGLDYPTDQIQQQQQQPSRASQINNLVDFVSDSYKQNKLLFSFVMNQVGLSQALPYVEQFLGNPNEFKDRS